jgi:hypothetical protein
MLPDHVPRARTDWHPLALRLGENLPGLRLIGKSQLDGQHRDQLALFARLPRELAKDLSRFRTLRRWPDQANPSHQIKLLVDLARSAHVPHKFDQQIKTAN